MFSFKVEQINGLREELEYLCRKYAIGKATIRTVKCIGNRVMYYVDVTEPTAEGRNLLRWLREGHWVDKQRKTNPDFLPELSGPIWVTETNDGFILRRWWLKITRS